MHGDREHLPPDPRPGEAEDESDQPRVPPVDGGATAPPGAGGAPDPGALLDLPQAPAPAPPRAPIVLGGSDGTDPFDPFDPDGEARS
ncbi:hypothetical protein [Oerskovia turbata]